MKLKRFTVPFNPITVHNDVGFKRAGEWSGFKRSLGSPDPLLTSLLTLLTSLLTLLSSTDSTDVLLTDREAM